MSNGAASALTRLGVLLVPRMELQDQATVDQQPIVAIAMFMFRHPLSEQRGTTAAYHIAHGNRAG